MPDPCSHRHILRFAHIYSRTTYNRLRKLTATKRDEVGFTLVGDASIDDINLHQFEVSNCTRASIDLTKDICLLLLDITLPHLLSLP